jgi:TRAP-type C4-dicarboxylate transport system substrate-binding protein
MKRFFLFIMISIVVNGLILGVYVPPAPAQKPIELTMTYQYPPNSDKDLHLQRWAKKIEEDSKGRLRFRIFAGAVLVNAFETYSSIPKGVADIGFGPRYAVGAPFTDEIFAMALMGTPNVATSTLVVEDLMKKYPEYYAKEWGDTKILWLQADPSSNLFTRNKPIRTPEEVKGLELRAPIKPAVEAWKALGAKPVSMPLSDFVLGLQKGTVDGGTTTKGDIKSFKFPSVAKYFTDFALFACPTIFMVMNLNKWNALPPDLQKVIEDNSKWGKVETVKFLDEDTENSKEWAMKEGMEFLTLKPEEKKKWVDAIGPVYLKLAADLDAKGYPASSAFKFAQERLAHYMK